jgi:hypothetical protein
MKPLASKSYIKGFNLLETPVVLIGKGPSMAGRLGKASQYCGKKVFAWVFITPFQPSKRYT